MNLVKQLGLLLFALTLLAGCQTVARTSGTSASGQNMSAETPRYVKRATPGRIDSKIQAGEALAVSQNQPRDLWQMTREKMALPDHSDRKVVQDRIAWYAKHERYLDTVATRASRYYYYIFNEVTERGMPAEIALLPAIESSYDPFVKSPARAAGPWQFIPSTADHFGLKRNGWYDGRKDIVASTQAALTYLNYLHDFFDGDWLLALAAYNAGEGRVQRAVRKNKRQNKPTDFWSLDLPRETRAYVPKLLAIAEIFKRPERHGLELNVLENTPYFEVVETGGQIDLNRVSQMANLDLEEIRHLNPGFIRWATDPEGPHRILLPVGKANSFRQELASLDPSDRLNFAQYEIRQGDTLSSIASRYNTSVASIRSANGIRGNLIRAGQSVLIPAALMDTDAYTLSSNQTTERRINKAPPQGRSRHIHQIESGDSLWSIARRYGASTQELAKWNDMPETATLGVGQPLVVFIRNKDRDAAASSKANTVETENYRVKKGDNLSLIAQLHDVSISQLLRWNALSPDTLLQPGQELQVAPRAENS